MTGRIEQETCPQCEWICTAYVPLRTTSKSSVIFECPNVNCMCSFRKDPGGHYQIFTDGLHTEIDDLWYTGEDA